MHYSLRSDRPAQVGAVRPLAVAALLLGASSALIGWRNEVVRLAPPMAGLYAAVNLPVNLRKMDFRKVGSRLVEDGGRKILVVEGEIHNLARTPQEAPRVRLAVLDAEGREIYAWSAAPPKARLLAGETAFFRARLAAPPAEGSDVRLRFADAERAS